MFIKPWHISLWGMFDDAVTILRHDDCVGPHRLLPFASRLYPIPIDFFGDIDRVVNGAFAIDDRVVAVHAIVHYNRVDCLVYGVSDGVAVYGVEARIKASATHAHKEYCSHTQCQGESL